MVEGTINGFPFRAALEPNGKGSHGLRVNQAMHDAAGADAGDTVTVEITRAEEEPETRVPMDLRKALAAAPLAQALWAEITPMARQNWILWISSAKQPETRRSRIEKACDMLASGKRRVCCFGGLNWLRKDHATAAEHGFSCRTQKIVFRRDRQSRRGLHAAGCICGPLQPQIMNNYMIISMSAVLSQRPTQVWWRDYRLYPKRKGSVVQKLRR